MDSKIIRVSLEPMEFGRFFATSPDMRGLHLTGADIEGLAAEVEIAIEAIFEANGTPVRAQRLAATDPKHALWEATPVLLPARRRA